MHATIETLVYYVYLLLLLARVKDWVGWEGGHVRSLWHLGPRSC